MSGTPALERMRTGISGLDEALGGGLPRGRTTLVVGSTGAGKTIFAVQTLAQGVRLGEPGVLLTFEESPKDILANMAAFAWAPSGRAATRLSIMDGREVRTAFRNGSFDLVGLLSAVEHRCRRMKARRIAFDGLDVLLDMIDDPAVMRREVYRLSDWLSEQALTAIITAKRQPDDEALPSRYAFLPFLTDCVIVLQHRVVGRTAMRELRILKCRGVAHSSNEMPMLLSSSGLEVGRAADDGNGAPGLLGEDLDRRRAAGHDARRRLPARHLHARLRRSRHVQDLPGGSLRRGGLRPRRAHALRELRRSRRTRSCGTSPR